MHHCIEGSGQSGGVHKVAAVPPHPRLPAQPGKEGRFTAMGGNDVTAAACEGSGDEGARKSCRARDEYTHSSPFQAAASRMRPGDSPCAASRSSYEP